MRTRHRKLTFFGLVMFTGFAAFALATGRTPDVVGEVVNSSNATVEGGTLLSNCTIFSGDAVNVGEGGSVLLSFLLQAWQLLPGQPRCVSAALRVISWRNFFREPWPSRGRIRTPSW